MKRLTTYINKLVNLTIKTEKGNFTLSGYVTAVGKEHILLIDQDRVEYSFKRRHISEITNIPKKPKK
jgi:hypothetical protein